jgi:hypothetical protein
MDPYRTQPSRERAPRAARLDRAWHHEAAAPLIVASAPIALVGLCAVARACEGWWLMPATIFYAVIGYVVFLLCACTIDVMRR